MSTASQSTPTTSSQVTSSAPSSAASPIPPPGPGTSPAGNEVGPAAHPTATAEHLASTLIDSPYTDAPSKDPLTAEVTAEKHETNTRPALQTPPSSITIPPPATPSTTLVIIAPPSPDHITIAPAVTPVLAIGGLSHTPELEPTYGHEPLSAASVIHPVERIDTLVDLPVHTAPRSRRNSMSDSQSASTVGKPKPGSLPIPARPAYSKSASTSDFRSGLASPNIPSGAIEVLIASVHATSTAHTPSASQHVDPLTILTLFAGKHRKAFRVHRHLLVTRVPYFEQMFGHDIAPGPNRLTFDDLDEFGFALFVRFLYGGELNGPHDFNTFTHYLSLYCLALEFGVEDLQNETMDLCRAYYRHNSMTAPAYRLEYIYTFSSASNHMRDFLTTTAAYRCLCEAPATPDEYISDSLRGVIVKGGDIGVDFAAALIKLSKNGLVDVRKGDDCVFHEHADGKNCIGQALEPYQSD